MTTYSVAEAKNSLSELIDRALRGEGVVITRHGAAVVELRPVAGQIRTVAQADLDWLAANRLQPARPTAQPGGDLVSGMRDEEGH
ncbi:MAG: type II toxin-antitoxin system Phd/YefM family antitoxin [Hyphomonadaceae bacterium]